MPRHKGFKHTEESKEKTRQSLLGHSVSQETRNKIGEKLKGRKVWNSGKTWDVEIRQKISETNKRKGIEPIIKCIQRGADNNRWKGGITSENKLERTKFKRLLQKHIYERDNYTCQICGSRGVRLHVDHIKSWKHYEELRFDPDNCRTLCVKCHYEITYGKPMPDAISTWGLNKQSGHA